MQDRLLEILQAESAPARDRSLRETVAGADTTELLGACETLERFWRQEPNLYRRVRTLLFLSALQRLELPASGGLPRRGAIPPAAVEALNRRRFTAGIDIALAAQASQGPSESLGSLLAAAYRALAFDTLSRQVRSSVRAVPGNQWMFAHGDASRHPRRVVAELLDGATLVESTPVRMDFSHSAWSDIFFLAMDAPEAARVLNVSIDLSRPGDPGPPRPPIEVALDVIDEPCLRLSSIDLGAQVSLHTLPEVFDFAADHLGLLRAGLVAGGLVPAGLEGRQGSLTPLLASLLGEGRGLALSTHVHGIPKGSRLAVSTHLLAAIIAAVMRATGQTEQLSGPLDEDQRRLVCARAILGEWLGGSGGGWQDSAGLWPGIKLIEGARAEPGDPEWGVSRGRLLPRHRLFGPGDCPADMAQRLADSLVLAHGGLAQDVGPLLELVTEKYLLREPLPGAARHEVASLFCQLLAALKAGDVHTVGRLTQQTYDGPLQAIIPWAANAYTESVVSELRRRFGAEFWGFWMLGGMAGGGMGFLFDPRARERGRQQTLEVLREAAKRQRHEQPFAMEPVVYDFAVNTVGSVARLQRGPASDNARGRSDTAPAAAQADTDCQLAESATADRSLQASPQGAQHSETLDELLITLGFDRPAHDVLGEELRRGDIGLARNRLPARTVIEDARPGDVTPWEEISGEQRRLGAAALARGELALVTLAGGLGSRWTRGAGVVKALNPFWNRDGRWRSFLDVHRAKCRSTARRHGCLPVHVITTSWLTHEPIADWCQRDPGETAERLSRGCGVGLRMIPSPRDLQFLWQSSGRQQLDERAETVEASLHQALLAWATELGPGNDYRDNIPEQCLHPLGHGHELASLILNGTLRRLLNDRPALSTLLLHNVDTLGVDLSPGLFGRHLQQGPGLTFEVVPRRLEDRGGGLARVDGVLRLVESLALPDESLEWRLGWYNSLTTWIDIDHWLAAMNLDRASLTDEPRVRHAVQGFLERLPVYVTLKDVKQRWGRGHEDVYPVSQWERLWGDVSALPELSCRYVEVPLARGRQLKDPAQLDTWLADGTADWVASRCNWPRSR